MRTLSRIITTKITAKYGMTFNLQFFMSAIVASLTVGGKAIFKSIAIKNSDKIIFNVGKFVSIFKK